MSGCLAGASLPDELVTPHRQLHVEDLRNRIVVPLVEHPSEVVVGSVVGHGFGVQRPVDSWLPSLHGQTIQLHCGCYTAWVAVDVHFRGAGRRPGKDALVQCFGGCGVLGLFNAGALSLPQLLPKSHELLTEGVRAVLTTWPVLQIAVDNGFGGVYGQQKADWMVDVVQQYFHDNADLQQFEVEDFIAQLMDQEFDTVVDDGSLPQVSVSLLQVFSQWQQGALQQLKLTISSLTQRSGQRAKVSAPPTGTDDDSDDETQVMECESSSPSVSRTDAEPCPRSQDEDDGWTVVRKKK